MPQFRILSLTLCFLLAACQSGNTKEEQGNNSVSVVEAESQQNLEPGFSLYTQHCANCHGKDAQGKRAIGAPDIRGKSAEDIALSNQQVSMMSGLNERMSPSDIAGVADFLATLVEDKD